MQGHPWSTQRSEPLGSERLKLYLDQMFRGEMSFVGPRSLAIGEIVQDEKGRVVKELGVRLFKLIFSLQLCGIWASISEG